jgi:hypothetical protein
MAKPKQIEIPIEGKGVSPVKDRKLDKLGDEFIENRDTKARLAGELAGIESKIIDRMTELEIKSYKFSDQLVSIKTGKHHITIKTIKIGVEDSGDE